MSKKQTVGVHAPKAEERAPLDLGHALRPLTPDARSAPFLLGKVVTYVQDDGTEAEAKVLALFPDGRANLLIAMGHPLRDTVYQQQIGDVALGRPGDKGTWHEVER